MAVATLIKSGMSRGASLACRAALVPCTSSTIGACVAAVIRKNLVLENCCSRRCCCQNCLLGIQKSLRHRFSESCLSERPVEATGVQASFASRKALASIDFKLVLAMLCFTKSSSVNTLLLRWCLRSGCDLILKAGTRSRSVGSCCRTLGIRYEICSRGLIDAWGMQCDAT